MFIHPQHPKSIELQHQLQSLAKQLRKRSTPSEQILWQYLRNRKLQGFKFKRQHPLYQYIADFYCHEKKLVIEVDGLIHEQQQVYDENRDKVLQQAGYTVVRFTNDQVLQNITHVLQSIIVSLSHEERDRG